MDFGRPRAFIMIQSLHLPLGKKLTNVLTHFARIPKKFVIKSLPQDLPPLRLQKRETLNAFVIYSLGEWYVKVPRNLKV